MPRLFTGLEIPASQRTALSLLQGGVPGMRWIEPSDFHITLRFIGNVSPRTADDIVEALSSRLWIAPEIRFSELSSFGGGTPTSVFARIVPDDALTNLSASQERLMQRIGLPCDPRRFTPHVTIARCRGVTPDKVARYLGQRGGFFTPPPFTPTRFVLYSARESVGGGPYRVEQAWPLELPVAVQKLAHM